MSGETGTRPALTRVGLGCVTFGREIGEAVSFEIMDYAAAHGIRLLDTAESYGEGQSERIVERSVSGVHGRLTPLR